MTSSSRSRSAVTAEVTLFASGSFHTPVGDDGGQVCTTDVAVAVDAIDVYTGQVLRPRSPGQRRYVESLSAYARQFLGLMEKPNVDYIEGLSPAISIDQKGASRNP
ncbi:hypothetical protein LCGC14_2677780, partial [marine sediment metagenome]